MTKPFSVFREVASSLEVETDSLVSWVDIWDSYPDTGFREVSHQMIELVVTKAAQLYFGLQEMELGGGFSKPVKNDRTTSNGSGL
jgi:hypothetical protein